MSTTSRRSSAKTNSAASQQGFDPKILARAKRIAHGYRIIIERHADLGYKARSLEIPTAFADGRTPNACVKAMEDALVATIATILVNNKRPPLSSRQAKTGAQINIRVNMLDKLLLEEAAEERGFKGVSDFVRTVAIRKAQAGTS